jgi:hypothetical protein
MSSIALILQYDISQLYPEYGQGLAAVVLASVIVMELLGPVATQWGFRFAGESAPDAGGGAAGRSAAARPAPSPKN